MISSKRDIRLPDLGEVAEVIVVAWLCSPGDRVAEGDDLVEVETEKTTFVVPAPASGRLLRVAAGSGDKVSAGGLLGELEPEAG